MNKCNEQFIENRQIDINSIDNKIYYPFDINRIADLFGILSEEKNKNVCVGQIIGFSEFNSDISSNLSTALDSFFDFEGSGYHTRSVDMLKYDENNVIEGLNSSFLSEPICTTEIDNGYHVITSNGKHRFLVLRLLYLNAKSKCQTPEELAILNEKFTIPVKTKKVDLIKTYCKYLIALFQPAQIMDQYFRSKGEQNEKENGYYVEVLYGFNNVKKIFLSEEKYQDYMMSVNRISAEYDENFWKTGNCVVEYFNGEKKVLSDIELIDFTKNIIEHCKYVDVILKDTLSYLDFKIVYENIESFRNFLQNNFSDIFEFNETEVIRRGSFGR